jgi:hypothetical protein
MLERFTERARNVLSRARLAALSFDQSYIDTEHLLLGLIDEGWGVALYVLTARKNFDVNLLRQEIENRLTSSSPGPPLDLSQKELPFTPAAKKVLEFAVDEAREMEHKLVDTEHLLLGMIREKDGVAAEILTRFGVGHDDFRSEVLDFLASDHGKALKGRKRPLWQMHLSTAFGLLLLTATFMHLNLHGATVHSDYDMQDYLYYGWPFSSRYTDGALIVLNFIICCVLLLLYFVLYEYWIRWSTQESAVASQRVAGAATTLAKLKAASKEISEKK